MSRPLECGFHPSLPPELVAAPLEFDAWSQAQLLIEQSESTRIEPLYHYTAEEALKGIWESNGSGPLVTCTRATAQNSNTPLPSPAVSSARWVRARTG